MADNQLLYGSFKDFELHGVLNTERELRKGKGPYSLVELEFHGLKCAGKKISQKFFDEATSNEKRKIWQKLEQECKIMSNLRHPNIVQFMGVLNDDPLPIVVTEFLPLTLNSHLKSNGVMPNHVSYSILDDVATALCYLHGHKPEPLVHGSLTADNILLTKNRCAKIAYLGEAKILGLKSPLFEHPVPLACAGTDTATANNPKRHQIDIFSFGILVIHTLSGNYPMPPENSEQDSVEFALQQINARHPLTEIVKQCLGTENSARPNIADMLDHIRCIRFQFNNNIDDGAVVQEDRQEHVTASQPRTSDASLAMVEELRLTAGIARNYTTFTTEDERIDASELKMKTAHLEEKINILCEELESKRVTIHAKNDTIQKLVDEKERTQDTMVDFKIKQKEMLLKDQIFHLNQRRISNLQCLITAISNNMPHPLNMKCKLTWKESAMLPFGITAPQHVIIGSVMYVGGGQTDSKDHKHMVLRYCTISTKWDILPPSPFMHFGLGQYEGKLITVGGSCKDDDATATAEVMYFDKTNKEWVKLLAPMPTARRRACVVSHESSMAVCGGIEKDGRVSSVVEVFQHQQWQTASSLLKPRAAMGVAVKDDTVYLTGGYYPGMKEWNYAQKDCQCVSLSSLLQGQFAKWEVLTALPVISTMVISHSGTLMAIGGLDAAESQPTNADAVYVYSKAMKTWIQADKLPFSCSSMMVASMYSNEIYVVGGWQDKKRSKRVMIGAYNQENLEQQWVCL